MSKKYIQELIEEAQARNTYIAAYLQAPVTSYEITARAAGREAVYKRMTDAGYSDQEARSMASHIDIF